MTLGSILYSYPWIVPYITWKLYHRTPFRIGAKHHLGIADPNFINNLWRGSANRMASLTGKMVSLDDVVVTEEYFSNDAILKLFELEDFGDRSGFDDRAYRTKVLRVEYMLSSRGQIHEARQRWHLNDQLAYIRASTGRSSVPVLLGDSVYRIHSIDDLPENTQKADMMGVGPMGEPVLYISYKELARSTPQQWGGISRRESLQWETPEVQAFIFDVAERRASMDLNAPFYFRRPIKDRKIKMRALFGSDYHPKRRGPNSVHAVVVGNMYLKKRRSNWELIAEGAIYVSGQLPPPKYMPTLAARFDADRQDADIPFTRLGVFPHSRRGVVREI